MDKKFQTKTRGVFHKLHSDQAKDKPTFNRLLKLLSPEYLGVPQVFFKDKICLDAGCGSNANATYRLLEMGAKKVCAFDLNKTIFEVAPKMLKPFEGRYELKTASVHDIPYPDGTFDFVHCAGVLHHSGTRNTAIYKGLSELARVTKKGGLLFINVHGKYGIMRDFMTTLREKYRKDSHFKKFIDNLSEDDLHAMWDFIVTTMAHHEDPLGKQIPKALAYEMLNKDLVLTIKDRIQAPSYLQSTEAELTSWLKKHGFTQIRRVTRYPKLHNIRRFLAPLYWRYDNPYARVLFGEGEPQLIARKAR